MNQSDVDAHRCTDLRYDSSSSSLMRGDLGCIYDVLLRRRSVLINSRAVLLSGMSILINSRAVLLSDSGVLIRFLPPSLRD